MQNWKVISLLVIITILILWRKKISAWLDSNNVPDNESLPASAKTGLDNLKTSLQGSKAFDLINTISQESLSKETKNKELLDNAPMDQLMLNQSDFIKMFGTEKQKILVIPPKAPNQSQSDYEKIRMRRDSMWWPELAYELSPTFENFEGCSCGHCNTCSTKIFSWQ